MLLTPDLQAAIVQFLENAESQLVAPVPEEGPLSPRPASMQPHNNNNHEVEKLGLSQLAAQAGSTGASIVRRLAPFGLQMVVSAAAYSAGLGLFQLLGYGLRVSCNTRIVSSCLGCLGVGFSSAMSCQLSRHVQREMERGGPVAVLTTPPWKHADAEEALLDAVVGLTCFKMWRGQFRSIMPSHLCQPGAYAVHSLPIEGDPATSGQRYAMGGDRKLLQTFFKKDGCHHCGKKSGEVIGDHIPPTKLFKEMRADKQAGTAGNIPQPIKQALSQAWNAVARLSGEPLHQRLRQRYYPQCGTCSNLQAQVLRHGVMKPLYIHWRLWRLPPPGFVPGLMACLRPVSPQPMYPPPPPPSGSPPRSSIKTKAAEQAGQDRKPRRLAWWTSIAASMDVGMSQQVQLRGGEVQEGVAPGDREDHTSDVARADGLWGCARRVEETLGPDMWTCVEPLGLGGTLLQTGSDTLSSQVRSKVALTAISTSQSQTHLGAASQPALGPSASPAITPGLAIPPLEQTTTWLYRRNHQSSGWLCEMDAGGGRTVGAMLTEEHCHQQQSAAVDGSWVQADPSHTYRAYAQAHLYPYHQPVPPATQSVVIQDHSEQQGMQASLKRYDSCSSTLSEAGREDDCTPGARHHHHQLAASAKDVSVSVSSARLDDVYSGKTGSMGFARVIGESVQQQQPSVWDLPLRAAAAVQVVAVATATRAPTSWPLAASV